MALLKVVVTTVPPVGERINLLEHIEFSNFYIFGLGLYTAFTFNNDFSTMYMNLQGNC